MVSISVSSVVTEKSEKEDINEDYNSGGVKILIFKL